MLRQIDQFGKLVDYPERHPEKRFWKICFKEPVGPFHGELSCCGKKEFSIRIIAGVYQDAIYVTCTTCAKEYRIQEIQSDEQEEI